MLGSLLGLGTSVGGAIPGLLQGDRERDLNRLAQGKGPSAARTMLANQGAQNAANAQAVASAQPGGLGLLQGLRSAETANRDAAQQMGQARVQEQLGAIGAAKQARDQRMAGIGRVGAAIGQFGSSLDATDAAAKLAEKQDVQQGKDNDYRTAQLDMQRQYLASRFGTPAPQTAVSPAQRADLGAAYASRGPGNAVVAPTTTIRAPQPQPQAQMQMRGAPVGTPSGTLNTGFRAPIGPARGNAAVLGTYEPDSMQSSATSPNPLLANAPQNQAFMGAYDQEMAAYNQQYSPAEQRALDLEARILAMSTGRR